MPNDDQKSGQKWSWVLWKCDIPHEALLKNMNEKDRSVEVVVRAMDNSFNGQLRDVNYILNGTLYVNNSWVLSKSVHFSIMQKAGYTQQVFGDACTCNMFLLMIR